MKVRRTIFLLNVLVVSVILVYIGCKGERGPTGPAGSNPPAPPRIQAVYAIPDSVGTSEVATLVVNAYDPNGDSLAYQWSVTAGMLQSPSAAVTEWMAPDTEGVYTATVTVSDASSSVNGTVQIGVNRYVPSVTPSYLGANTQNCFPCHTDKINSWLGTPHAVAFADTFIPLAARTTGYNVNLDNGGYDDRPGPQLENVQCEACHGPLGPGTVNHASLSPGAMTGENCGTCHVQWTEYRYSGHGTAMERAGGHEQFNEEWVRAPCWDCHVGEGFVKRFDPDWADRSVPHQANQVACGACHDAHQASADTPSQLRGLAEFALVYGGEEFPQGFGINSWGRGQLCGQCHHARRDRTYIMNAINRGAQRADPHPSAQADMVAGRGSYEIPGYTYDRGNQHDFSNILTNVCVSCHMYQETQPFAHGNHNFHPNPQLCAVCHSGATNFDIDGKQTEIQSLMNQLGLMLPHTVDENDVPIVAEDTRDSTIWTVPMREAAWAWQFVHSDKSRGVHNYPYTRSLLQNAIDYLSQSPFREPRPLDRRFSSLR